MLSEKIEKVAVEDVDWDKVQLLISDGVVVLSNSNHVENGYFEGTVVYSDSEDYKIGNFEYDWNKESFTLYTGAINLQND